MSSQGIKRRTLAFLAVLQELLAGLEIDLDVPSISLPPDDFLFRKADICAYQNNPVLFVRFVTDIKEFCRHTLQNFSILFLDEIDIH